MKKLILTLIVLFVVFSVQVSAQQVIDQKIGKSVLKVDVFTAKTLSAGTVMSARTLSSTYDDTTRAFNTRGFAAVYVGVELAANDSGRVLLSYQPGKDGTNFSSLVLVDSLSTTGTVGIYKYFALPANALGAYSCRVRVYGNTDLLRYSSSPSTTVTTKIIRVPFQ